MGAEAPPRCAADTPFCVLPGGRRRAALWVALVGVLLAAPAFAEEAADPVEQARAHHDRGIELFEAEQYEEAVVEFEAAEALAPAPPNLYNMARCHQELGRNEAAIEVLDRYLALDLPPDRVERARALRAELAGAPGQLEVVTTPPGAEVLVDGRPAEGVSPLTVEVPVGTHMVEARLEGAEPARQEVEVGAGATARLELSLTVEGAPPPTQEPRVVESAGLAISASLQVSAGASVLVTGAQVPTTFASGLDVGVGFDFGMVRLELMAQLYVIPGPTRMLIEASGAGRLGVRLGALPVRIEGELAVGLAYLRSFEVEAAIAEDTRFGLSLAPSLLVSWQILDWLELVLRPARLEILGVEGNLTGDMSIRWGADLGVRFRLQ